MLSQPSLPHSDKIIMEARETMDVALNSLDKGESTKNTLAWWIEGITITLR